MVRFSRKRVGYTSHNDLTKYEKGKGFYFNGLKAYNETTMSKKFTTGQTWGALKKAWKAYKIAKVQNDKTRLMEYAKRIRTLQEELGVEKAKFPDLNLT